MNKEEALEYLKNTKSEHVSAIFWDEDDIIETLEAYEEDEKPTSEEYKQILLTFEGKFDCSESWCILNDAIEEVFSESKETNKK